MKVPVMLCVSLVFAALRIPAAAPAADSPAAFAIPEGNYLLNCGGCHGTGGISNSKLVPDLKNQVGYFLNAREGREYLVRLPNVAFSTLSDRDLADVLNFMVFQIGGASVPGGAVPYTASEVGHLRKLPLNEVSLIEYRTELVDRLITEHQASQGLRIYGSDRY
jgi:cytochrome c553